MLSRGGIKTKHSHFQKTHNIFNTVPWAKLSMAPFHFTSCPSLLALLFCFPCTRLGEISEVWGLNSSLKQRFSRGTPGLWEIAQNALQIHGYGNQMDFFFPLIKSFPLRQPLGQGQFNVTPMSDGPFLDKTQMRKSQVIAVTVSRQRPFNTQSKNNRLLPVKLLTSCWGAFLQLSFWLPLSKLNSNISLFY